MKNDLRPLLQQAKLLNVQIKKILERYDTEFKGKDPKSFKEQQINDLLLSICRQLNPVDRISKRRAPSEP